MRMEAFPRHHEGRTRRATVLAAFLLLSSLGLTTPARAQAELDVEGAIDASEAVVDDLLSPLPSETATATINDTIEGLEDTTKGATEDPASVGNVGAGDPSGSGSTGGGSGGGAGPAGAGGGTTTAGANDAGGSTADGAAGATTPGAPTGSEAGDGGAPGFAEPSYQTLAAKGTGAAIRRAVALAGPLAPPLALGAIALILLIGIARGSDRLVRIEEGTPGRQVYRL